MKRIQAITGFVILSATVLILSTGACMAGGGGISGGATEVTQLANKAQLVKQLAEQVKTVQNLVLQYENMLQNTLTLPEKVWSDATKQLAKLQSAMQKAGALSYSAGMDDAVFKERNPGYRPPEDFGKTYKGRVDNWSEYVKAVMEANGFSWDEIQNEAELLKQLQDNANSSQGQHQALQAGNNIAAYMADQLRKLRADMVRQIDAQAAFAQNEQQERTDETAAMEAAIGKWKEPTGSKSY